MLKQNVVLIAFTNTGLMYVDEEHQYSQQENSTHVVSTEIKLNTSF